VSGTYSSDVLTISCRQPRPLLQVWVCSYSKQGSFENQAGRPRADGIMHGCLFFLENEWSTYAIKKKQECYGLAAGRLVIYRLKLQAPMT
jgi:hypothetical protein